MSLKRENREKKMKFRVELSTIRVAYGHEGEKLLKKFP